jgi:cytidylate kinase
MSSTLPESLTEKIIAEKIKEWQLKKQQNKVKSDQAKIEVHPFLAISRDFGCGEEKIIPHLEQALGWKVYGRNMLDHLAVTENLSRSFMETLDERRQLLVDKWVNYLIHSGAILPENYVMKISRLIKVIVAHESAIFLGRGCNYILEDKKEGLRIRLTAPFAERVKNIATLRSIPEKEAEEMVRETDRERKDFIKSYFGKEMNDQPSFDLAFNTSTVEPDAICKVIELLLEDKKK